jgi:hypothetical protein
MINEQRVEEEATISARSNPAAPEVQRTNGVSRRPECPANG